MGGTEALRDTDTELIAQTNFMAWRADNERLEAFRSRNAAFAWIRAILAAMEHAQSLGAGAAPQARPEPTLTFDDRLELSIGGRQLVLLSTPGGETTDSLVIWLPETRTAFTGNLFGPLFGHVPNLVTMRGDRYRDALAYVDSLDLVLDLAPARLLTGHFDPIEGADQIAEEITAMRDATQWVHDTTVEGMNAGEDVQALMRRIRLPEHFDLGEGYGKTSWNVRAIWENYAGWFHHGSTTELYDVPADRCRPRSRGPHRGRRPRRRGPGPARRRRARGGAPSHRHRPRRRPRGRRSPGGGGGCVTPAARRQCELLGTGLAHAVDRPVGGTMTNQISFDFADAVVLVTGGTSGIGHAVATAFAQAGAEVTVTGTRGHSGDYDTDLTPFSYRRVEMTDAASIDALVDSLGSLDVLVNNAGANFPGGRDEWEPDTFAAAITVNLVGPMRLTMGVRERLAASAMDGGASVVNMASLSAFRSVPVVPGYGSAKAGLITLTRNLARQWVHDGIRVNAVAPGVIDTPMTAPMAHFPELLDVELAHTPMGRLGTPRGDRGCGAVPGQFRRQLHHRPRPCRRRRLPAPMSTRPLLRHYHVGIVVPDVAAAQAELSRQLGVTWGPVLHLDAVEYRDGSGHDIVLPTTICYSVDEPHLELIQEVPGSVWECNEYSNLHHIGFWCDDLTAASSDLVGTGLPAATLRPCRRQCPGVIRLPAQRPGRPCRDRRRRHARGDGSFLFLPDRS